VHPIVPAFSEIGSDARADSRDFVLPPLTLADPDTLESPEAGALVFVRAYRVDGSTVLTARDIERATSSYRDRLVAFSDLQRLRDALTQTYVGRGFVTSGVVLPEQTIRDGVVHFEAVEGRLGRVSVRTSGRLASDYVARRVWPRADEPVNVSVLQRRLRSLQSEGLVRSIQANLLPAEERGEATLELAIEEARAYSMRVEVDNGLSPSIGGERSLIRFEHRNVSGVGDTAQLAYGIGRGYRELQAAYAFPISRAGTRLELQLRSSSSEVIEDPFDSLDIRSRAATYAIALHQPVWTDLDRRLEISLSTELRRSKSFLLGSGFSFSPGTEDGESKLSVIRCVQDFTWASRGQALALRSTLSVGLGALGATTRKESSVPDSRFVAWLAQIQYARKLGGLGAQLIARGDLQLSDDPLLGLEQFASGGRSSVRGYRENVRVRDAGAVASLELRLPVWEAANGRASLELAPFIDGGLSWNRRRPTRDGRTLLGIGIGARLRVGATDWELYWADALRELPTGSAPHDLQDGGLHLRMKVSF